AAIRQAGAGRAPRSPAERGRGQSGAGAVGGGARRNIPQSAVRYWPFKRNPFRKSIRSVGCVNFLPGLFSPQLSQNLPPLVSGMSEQADQGPPALSALSSLTPNEGRLVL